MSNESARLLDPGFDLTLRPMRYPQFFQLYKDSIKNIWTTDELDFSVDYEHIRDRLDGREAHLIKRLVAFFATADNLVAHNLVLNFSIFAVRYASRIEQELSNSCVLFLVTRIFQHGVLWQNSVFVSARIA